MSCSRGYPVMLAVWLLAALTLLTAAPVQAVDTVLVPAGAVWKYLDDGSDQGTAWRAAGFDDTTWKSGAAQLGYGDGDEATVIGYGPDPNRKYITTYFRRAFSASGPAAFTSLKLRLVRDDGAVVYVNGAEVFRSNMPVGTITSATPAVVAIGGGDESTYVTTALAPGVLAAGTNLIAVEVHQANGTSSDLSFNLELLGSSGPTVTRGPYLQMTTPDSTVIRWRTDTATDGRVWLGAVASSLTTTVVGSAVGTEHELRVPGLAPSTRYYYAVGTSAGPLTGGTAEYFFTTAPGPGTAKPTRIWVLGDSGTGSSNQLAVRDAYRAYAGARAADLVLMLGDNAYPSGSDDSYQGTLFDVYAATLRQSPLWPSYGNHDAQSSNAATQSGPYFDMLTLPIQGEAGGAGSGTKAYYSFDHGNIHFIALDSSQSDRSPTGPMLTWLRSDLAANTRTWTIAFWHHPPYSKGSHNSDTAAELVQMRQNALPILEAAGVDLVLGGHSHSYERSVLLDGHYGLSSTLTAAMKKNAGDGREDGTGAYRKPGAGPAPHEGTVYLVAGSSGQISGGMLDHPAMIVSLNALGSVVLDVDGLRLDARFIDQAGVVRDRFTMLKGQAAPPKVTTTAATGVSVAGATLNGTVVPNGSATTGWLEWGTTSTLATFTQTASQALGSGTTGVALTQALTGLTASATYYYRAAASSTGGAVKGAIVSFTTTAASSGPATLAMTFNGKVRDRVGAGNTALAADGAMDGVLTATLTGGGSRTVTGLQLQSTAPGVWDTSSGTGYWALGVATSLDGALLNAAGTMAVSFSVATGGSFVVFASDYQNSEFAPGRTLTLTATFSDGTTATATTTVGASGGPATLALAYNGKVRDRVGAGNTALAADGALDGVLTARLTGGGPRTVTGLQLQSTAPGVWDTSSGTGYWVLGVATGLDGALLNTPGTMAVSFAVATGGSFVVFASDYQNTEFAPGRTLTLTATFSDGTTANAAITIP